MPQAGRVPRRAPTYRHGEDPEVQAARTVLGGPGAPGPLTESRCMNGTGGCLEHERSARQRLMASPQCPAPMTTVVVYRMAILRSLQARSGDGDRDGRRVGEDVVDGGPLLRLRDDRLDLRRGYVGVDPVVDPDPAEAVAHVRVGPRMPCRSISALTVACTECNWICRCWATAAMPAVR